MTNAPETPGGGTGAGTDAKPLFPSEGTFTAVVPLSRLDRATDAPEEDTAHAPEDGTACVAAEAHEDETTLIPARVSTARRGSRGGLRATTHGGSRGNAGVRPWLITVAVLFLSILAGAAAGSYL